MTWLWVLPMAVALWWLWDIRRVLGIRGRPSLVRRITPNVKRLDFRGAIPPARFCVVRWPDGHHFYNGCQGAKAREMYDTHNPLAGEEIELWELDNCRGVK